MLGNSKTGQITGFLMNNWVPDAVPRFIIADGTPNTLGWNVTTILNNSNKILRIVLNAGPGVGTMARLCRDFSNATVREVFLPKWFFIDLLVRFSIDAAPVNITLVQTAVPDAEKKIKIVQNFFIDGKLQMSANNSDNTKNWEEIQKFFARIGIGEFWSRFCGNVRPSWGILDSGRSGSLCLPETNFHYCYVKKDAELPDFIDDFDLSRVESLIQDSGLEPGEFINKNKRQREYIIKFIERMQASAESSVA